MVLKLDLRGRRGGGEIDYLVWVDSVQQAAEGGQNGYVQLQRDNTAGELNVCYYVDDYDGASSTARNGEDYQWHPSSPNTPGTVSFSDGSAYATIPIEAIDDSYIEHSESVPVNLTYPPNTPDPNYSIDPYYSQGIVGISDNDRWDVSVTPTMGHEDVLEHQGSGCGASDFSQFAISRSGQTDARDASRPGTTVYFEISGTADPVGDYSLSAEAGQLESLGNNEYTGAFHGDNAEFNLTVSTFNDGRIEEDETVTLTLMSSQGCGCGMGHPYKYDLAAPTAATVTILDDDHWTIEAEATDDVARERMSEAAQDPGSLTFTRTHDHPNDPDRPGDKTYGVTVTMKVTETITESITQTSASWLSDGTGDYVFVTTDGTAETFLGNFGHVSSDDRVENPDGTTTLVHRFQGTIPADEAAAKLKVQPRFDWEDENALYDPADGGSPGDQAGELVDLAITDISWSGLNEPGTSRIGANAGGQVQIKDGAILEAYLDYDLNRDLDVQRSVADETCYLEYNDDDDDSSGTADKDESPVSAEDDLTKALLYAWVDSPSPYHFDVELTIPASGVAKYWQEETKANLLTPTSGDRLDVGRIDGSSAKEEQEFWIEGAALGSETLHAVALCFNGTQSVSTYNGTETTALSNPAVRVDLDIDSDNNGYINTELNKPRRQAEDRMEEVTGKPITYFGSGSSHPEANRYVPLRLNIANNAAGRQYSLHYTDNVAVFSLSNGIYTQVASNYKWPLAADGIPDTTYWVKAVAAGDSGYPSGLDRVHVVVWDTDGTTELHRDTVALAVQDNSSQMTDWVIPNEWSIEGASVKTPMPFDGNALGPQREWTGSQPNDYNKFNKGDAYTKNAVTGPFTLTFDVELDQRFVQPDNGEPHEQTPDGDARKLSFVANSGVKFGPVDANKKYEIAILDVVKWVEWVEMAGGIEELGKTDPITGDPLYWDGDKVRVPLPDDGANTYQAEHLNTLMCAVTYGGSYDNMEDAQGVSATDWRYYYEILKNHYNRLLDRGSTSYKMQIQFTPAGDGNPSKITVSLKGTGDAGFVIFYEEENPTYVNDSDQTVPLGDDHISLQSHWGSGVTFENITISSP